MTIPAEITRDQFLEAAAPLFELLGVSPYEVYNPIIIGESITFGIVPREDSRQIPDERPPGTVVPAVRSDEPSALDYAEVTWHVTVPIVGALTRREASA